MATELTAERLAELRKLQRRALDNPVAFAADYVSAIADDGDALLRAAEERDKARADLHALRTALVEATMEPFDIGPCYIAGPLPLKQKHDGEAFAVQHERLLGVFGQLLDRVEAKASGATEACNRVWRERDRLRAQRDALVADGAALCDVLRDAQLGTREVWWSEALRAVDKLGASIRAAKENQ